MKNFKFRKIIPALIVAFCLAFLVRSLFFVSYVVDGESMEPTLYDGNFVMVNKIIYDIADVNRFDVIVFHANQEDDYVKRVIGLPGDKIVYKDDKLYINGEYMEEGFLDPFKKAHGSSPFTRDFTLKKVTDSNIVPSGKLFVMGDNRANSLDSRYFGFVSLDQLVGKVDIKYWPFSQIQLSFGK